MSSQVSLPGVRHDGGPSRSQLLSRSAAPSRRSAPAPLPFRSMTVPSEEAPHRDAELFYLQKQIQSQTPMVVVLEDGEIVEGCIEWYDRNSLKLRGRAKTLIFKSAIKYMYKVGDHGQ